MFVLTGSAVVIIIVLSGVAIIVPLLVVVVGGLDVFGKGRRGRASRVAGVHSIALDKLRVLGLAAAPSGLVSLGRQPEQFQLFQHEAGRVLLVRQRAGDLDHAVLLPPLELLVGYDLYLRAAALGGELADHTAPRPDHLADVGVRDEHFNGVRGAAFGRQTQLVVPSDGEGEGGLDVREPARQKLMSAPKRSRWG